jgi:hypothetical protein
MYRIHLRYIYTFYCFEAILDCDAIDEYVDVGASEVRFTLHDQEDGSFVLSPITEDHIGKFVIVTFPGKDNLVVHLDDEIELAYDEYYSVMGDDNHNVYEGTISLERKEG